MNSDSQPLAKMINIPGAVWVALIVAVTKWLSDSFPDQPWLTAVVIVLGAIAKLIEMYWPSSAGQADADEPAPAAAALEPADADNYTWEPEPAGRRRGALTFLLG